MNHKYTAIEVFLERSNEIDEAISRLHDIISHYALLDPDDINWDHVEDLDHYIALLKEIGESADEAQKNQ